MENSMTPQINRDRCDGCGLCVMVCWLDGLVIINGVVAIVEGVECDWCTQCEAVCINEAITCPYEVILG
ncbi:MAG TPA: 4Fe-4S binding protein [Dehalococcoidia bacterium]|nr:4Fe-4S binding protein [Dehalococcoidia bacterium]